MLLQGIVRTYQVRILITVLLQCKIVEAVGVSSHMAQAHPSYNYRFSNQRSSDAESNETMSCMRLARVS
jgi:hypothetical protein